MTAAPPSGGAPEPEVVVAATPPGSSKARQKKFHRHFKQVAAEERVLNCKYNNFLLYTNIQ